MGGGTTPAVKMIVTAATVRVTARRCTEQKGEKLRFGRLLGVDCNFNLHVSLVELVLKFLQKFFGM